MAIGGLGLNVSFSRIVVVYNPRSSQAKLVRGEVLAKVPEATRYEVEKTNVDDNGKKLAKVLRDGDLVVTVGGDATATIGINGCMQSGRDVVFAALPYGNFSDVARMLGVGSIEEILAGAPTNEIYPLEILVDDKHWRYGVGYFTAGLLAEATEMFDKREVRRGLRKGKRNLLGQLFRAMGWYGKSRKRDFLPKSYKYNGSVVKNTTDMIAMNTGRMSRVMRGKSMIFDKREFRAGVAKSGTWLAMIWFGTRSVLARVPLKNTTRAVMEFEDVTEIEVQGEGEYKRVKAKKIEVRKDGRGLKVVTTL